MIKKLTTLWSITSLFDFVTQFCKKTLEYKFRPDSDLFFEKCRIKSKRYMPTVYNQEKHWVISMFSYIPFVFNVNFFQVSTEFGEYRGTMCKLQKCLQLICSEVSYFIIYIKIIYKLYQTGEK